MPVKSVTIEEALDEYLLATSQLSADTRRWYAQHLGVFKDFCVASSLSLLTDLSASNVRRFLPWLESHPPRGRKLSSYTLHGYLQVVKSFCTWCYREELSPQDIGTRVDQIRVDIKLIQTFTPGQVAALFKAAGQSMQPLRNTAILAVLLDTGIRARELCTLTLEHTHLDAKDPHLQVRGKGRKERQVGLGQQSLLSLHRYISRERPVVSHDRTFVGSKGLPFAVRGLESLFARLEQSSDISGVRCSPHDCRHTFAVNYLKAGGNLYSLSRLLGHSSVQVTENYLRSLSQQEARNGGISVLNMLWR